MSQFEYTSREEHPSVTYDRPFRTLFEDGVELLEASEKSGNSDFSNTLARSSIICSLLLPELTANICIESLKLDGSIFSEVDKLAPIGKFDYFLKSRHPRRAFPVGTLPVQILQEIKRLRDTFVHPKKFRVEWTEQEDGSFAGSSKRTQYLDISMNPTHWYSLDAQKAMCGVHKFLSFYFRELCEIPARRVTDLLFSDDAKLDDSGSGIYYYPKKLHDNLARWRVDVSYFKIGKL